MPGSRAGVDGSESARRGASRGAEGRSPNCMRRSRGRRSAAPLPPETEALLLRYYRVKVESLQFCGPTNFHRPYWEGLDALLLTFPAILWLTRVFSRGSLDRANAAKLALRLVDDSFGFNKLLDAGLQAWAIRTLADRGEVAKLIARYI